MILSKAVAVALVLFGLLVMAAFLMLGALLLMILALSGGAGEIWLALALTFGAGVGSVALFVRLLLPLARSRWKRV